MRGKVTASRDGLITIDCGGCEVRAIANQQPGDRVLFGVRPEDVSLMEAGAQMPSTSAQNQLAARVVDVMPAGVTVRVVAESSGARFAATISRSSYQSLGLQTGSAITLLFKATAVHVRAKAD